MEERIKLKPRSGKGSAAPTGPRTDVAQVTRYTYDAGGELASVVNPLGQSTQCTARDANGRRGGSGI